MVSALSLSTVHPMTCSGHVMSLTNLITLYCISVSTMPMFHRVCLWSPWVQKRYPRVGKEEIGWAGHPAFHTTSARIALVFSVLYHEFLCKILFEKGIPWLKKLYKTLDWKISLVNFSYNSPSFFLSFQDGHVL